MQTVRVLFDGAIVIFREFLLNIKEIKKKINYRLLLFGSAPEPDISFARRPVRLVEISFGFHGRLFVWWNDAWMTLATGFTLHCFLCILFLFLFSCLFLFWFWRLHNADRWIWTHRMSFPRLCRWRSCFFFKKKKILSLSFIEVLWYKSRKLWPPP